jgi:hypothetical protein
MIRTGAQALSDEVAQGQAALDALPALVQDARRLQAKAAACARVLTGIRSAMSAAGPLFAKEFFSLRRGFLRQVGRPRRALRRRNAWLSWVRFWRASRYWIGMFILCLMVMTAVLWVVRNREWLVDQMQILLAPPPPPSSAPAANPASQPAPAGGAP